MTATSQIQRHSRKYSPIDGKMHHQHLWNSLAKSFKLALIKLLGFLNLRITDILDAIFSVVGIALCILGCWATSLFLPLDSSSTSPQLWQQKCLLSPVQYWHSSLSTFVSNYQFEGNMEDRRSSQTHHGDAINKIQTVGNSTKQITRFPQHMNCKGEKHNGGENLD